MSSKPPSKSFRSALLVSALFAAPVLAAETAAPAPSPAPAPSLSAERPCGRGGGRHHGFKRMGHRFERAVEQGRLSRAQADQFKAEAQQLRQEARAQREASGGQLTPEQRAQFKQRRQALREKVRAAMTPPAGQGA